MTTPEAHELLLVLREARGLLGRPDNDFTWSSWNDAEHAIAEIDGLIESVRRGVGSPSALSFVFLPTGPMQEVSLSSGWANEFASLANRFDAALTAALARE